MASETLTPAGYIQHHLKNLAVTVDEGSAFWTLHVDTLATSVIVGLAMGAGRKAGAYLRRKI